MYGILDLTFKPTTDGASPAAGRAAAIVRGDTYIHVFTFTNDDDTPFEITGTVAAQLRPARLTGATASSPTASFTVAVGGVDDNEVTISLTSAQTLALPTTPLFWDMQQTVSGVVTTLLAGKVKVLDDVTRVG
jgi:hypothetical protein